MLQVPAITGPLKGHGGLPLGGKYCYALRKEKVPGKEGKIEEYFGKSKKARQNSGVHSAPGAESTEL
ncbi:hypothetical protein HZH66_003448 [Vespula vulgaris]|uniref:Uncharacterized protein n=1 Tax=Vespula vulgaris TaxID=7454 RepID=A0A834KD90_VESVU|nr:hypothetical protein HZH66_003448 [Vespula vulgaris]